MMATLLAKRLQRHRRSYRIIVMLVELTNSHGISFLYNRDITKFSNF